MKNFYQKTFSLLLVCTFCISLAAQKKELTLEQILKGESHFITKDLPRILGWADENHYIEMSAATGGRAPSLLKVNVITGVSQPYNADKEQIFIKDGDIFYIDNDGTEHQLIKTEAAELNAVLSPDKQWVAFTRDNNLFAINLKTRQEIQYTTDGSDVILNGYASWVYYEEIFGRASQYRAFWWSPDSKHIAFMRFDDSKVPVFPIYSAEGQHGYLENTRYPKAGDPNPEVKTGFVNVEGGKIIWADFNAKDDQYFGTPFWSPDSKTLWMQWMPREQNNLKIYAVDITSGNKKEVYNENQETWIDWKSNVHFLADNSGYILQNDTDGWDNIYMYNMDGSLKQKLTSGNLWRTRILKIDEKAKTIYYSSCAENSTRSDFYSVGINGKNQKRLSFGEFSHQVRLSPTGKYYITTYSNVNTPTQVAVYETAKNKLIRELGNSKGEEFDNYNFAIPELTWLQTPDGFNIPALVTLPLNLDPSKKYPVIINVYGGPNSASVSDTWKGVGTSQWWAREGIIQVTIDHRGSGHNGKKGLNCMHRQLGKWEMEDYIQWVKWLREKPYVNENKIAITGGSYGGYVTAMALTYGADYFNYGIADFGVMDWHLYDSHYTERYMDTPQSNPEGYKTSSVFQYIDNYKSGNAMLRIVHGSTDDNVHMQNSIQLIKALQLGNKTFEMMIYPDCRHGWRGVQRTHNQNEIFRFYYQYLLDKKMPDEVYQ